MPAADERKLVTVLFADLVGSTELATRHDPEPLRAMLAAFFDEMRQQIEAYGGTVEKYAGDAVMAVFGVPTIHEDDAERAARAAVAMRDAMAQMNPMFELTDASCRTPSISTDATPRLRLGEDVRRRSCTALRHGGTRS